MDNLSDAAPVLEAHMKYCPQAKPNWLPRIIENFTGGSAAFIALVLVFGWSIHEHGWPWLGR